jgi:hypothetical protein
MDNLTINQITPIFNGEYYYMLLDFPTNKFLKHLISPSYKYVWVHNHWLTNLTDEPWEKFNLPLNSLGLTANVLAKNIRYDFIMLTADFIKTYNQLPDGINVIQMDKLPPPWLNLDKVNEKSRYDLLVKECDFLFEINIRYPRDYSELITKEKSFLNQLLASPQINWDDIE